MNGADQSFSVQGKLALAVLFGLAGVIFSLAPFLGGLTSAQARGGPVLDKRMPENLTTFLVLRPAPDTARRDAAEDSLETVVAQLTRRLIAMGLTDAQVARRNDGSITIGLPPDVEPSRVAKLITRTGRLEISRVIDQRFTKEACSQADALEGTAWRQNARTGRSGEPWCTLIAVPAALTEADISNAAPTQQDHGHGISLTFNVAGARALSSLTTVNVGRHLAVAIDGQVVSSPRVTSPIHGFGTVLTGNFSARETEDMALLLRSVALSVPLQTTEVCRSRPGTDHDRFECQAVPGASGSADADR